MDRMTSLAMVAGFVWLGCAGQGDEAGDSTGSWGKADGFNSALPSTHITQGDLHVLIEVFRDDIVHVEMTRADASYSPESIYLSPMVAARSFEGPPDLRGGAHQRP